MRIYTLSTESRSVFKDRWFLPSLNALPDKFELIVSSDSRQQDAPAYGTSEFNQVMETKTDLVVDAIRQCWGQVFMYSDIDVQFLQSFREKFLNFWQTMIWRFSATHLKGIFAQAS